jgi:hypothetical protein
MPVGRDRAVHSKRQISQIAHSVKTFGLLVPILVSEYGDMNDLASQVPQHDQRVKLFEPDRRRRKDVNGYDATSMIAQECASNNAPVPSSYSIHPAFAWNLRIGG